MASLSDEPLVIEVDPPEADDMDPQAVPPRRRLGIGAAIILVLAALAVTVVIGVVRTAASGAGSGTASASEVPTVAAAAPTATAGRVYVDVIGAVRHPGMFVLPAGARVLDAVSAAGGFAAKAQRDGVNLARPLTDGEQLVVPKKGAAQAAPGASASAATVGGAGASAGGAAGGKVDLNTATQEQLESLPRIGPALSQRILDWRQQNGRFTSVDDLLAVPGIGDKMLASLRDLVTV